MAQLKQETKDEFLGRLSAIEEHTKAQWGKMNRARVMAHLLHALPVSLEEAETTDAGNFS